MSVPPEEGHSEPGELETPDGRPLPTNPLGEAGDLPLMQRVLDGLPQFIFWKNRDSVYLGCNQGFALIAGYASANEIVGKSDEDLPWRQEESDGFRTWDRRVMDSDTPEYHVVEPQRRADGRQTWIETSRIPLHDDKGRVIGVLGAFEDVTEHQLLEQAAQSSRGRPENQEDRMLQSQRLESLGLLAGGVAHDFNNLLTGIMGNADLALTETDIKPELEEKLEAILEATKRAAELCQQVLAYSGKGHDVAGRADLNAVVQNTLKLLEATVSKRITVDIQLEDGPLFCKADVASLRQLLIHTAIHAADEIGGQTGSLVLRTGQTVRRAKTQEQPSPFESPEPGTYAFLEVEDNGRGLDASALEKLFDPTSPARNSSSGQGLTAVLSTVQAHEGALEVESEEGRGTLLRVLLPLADSKEERASLHPQVEDPAAEPLPLHGRVLIVDDEETVRSVASQMLERAGYEALVAADGFEAIELCGEQGSRIDCVLLDLIMPRIDGIETFRQLRRSHPRKPVILTSGFSEQMLPPDVIDAGIAGFLPKPFEASVLLRLLSRVLAGERPTAP